MVKIHESSLNSSDMGELGSVSESKPIDAVSDTLQAQKEPLPEKDLSDQDKAVEEPVRQTDNDENVETPTLETPSLAEATAEVDKEMTLETASSAEATAEVDKEIEEETETRNIVSDPVLSTNLDASDQAIQKPMDDSNDCQTANTSKDKGPPISSIEIKEEKIDDPPEDLNAVKVEPEDEDGTWCAVCHDGGDLLYCCDRCPRIYHLNCYIPALAEEPPDDWVINATTSKCLKVLYFKA